MRPLRPALQDLTLTLLADAVAQASDRRAAVETLVAGLARALDTRACVVERVPRGWTLIAQTPGGIGVALDDLQAALHAVPALQQTAVIDLTAVGEGLWSFLALTAPDGPAPMALLLAGDWTSDEPLSSAALLLSLALRSVREREERRRTERLLVDGYRLTRRLGRLGDLDHVCRRLVEQVSRSLNADRVALALYRPGEECLSIEATCGYPVEDVREVRIEPGAWVMGHVYASGRPVLVPDIRQVPAMATGRRRYRTHSFAATPVRAGRGMLGVLSATDKRDNSRFTRRDAAALRTFGASASLALLAVQKDREMHRLAHAAAVDSLTGLFNRQYLDARLREEVERARRGSSPLTVMMADIDDFKAINDRYGHQTGDAVLKAAGAVFRSAMRVFDVCARYGGDEFAILMPMSDWSSAAPGAERIRQRLAESAAAPGLASQLTVSIGVAVAEPGDTPDDLIRRADRCLYRAKAEGKNRVCLHAPPPVVLPMPAGGRRRFGEG
jgi:diguanylate cyclase (GGDEF)-like protein